MSEIVTPKTEPSERRLTANLAFHAVAEQNEPLGETVTYRLDSAGFWEERSAGSAGEERTPASLEAVAGTLTEHFDADELLAVLSQLAALRERIRS